jgi:predicted acylesterase/phospholipase RssA/CRP-like cAMP-binding protein
MCAGLDASEFARLSRGASLVDVPPGEPIFRAGATAETVYLIAEGRVGSDARGPEDMDSAPAATWQPGDFIGHYALLESGRYDIDVRALERSHLLAIPSENFIDLFESSPRFARNVVQALHARVRELHGWQHPEPVAHTVALITTGQRGRDILQAIEQGLQQRGERISCFVLGGIEGSDQARTRLDSSAAMRDIWSSALQTSDRVLLKIDPTITDTDLIPWLAQCDQIVWLVEPTSEGRLRELRLTIQQQAPQLDRGSWVTWILDPQVYAVPQPHPAWDFSQRHAVLEWPDQGRSATRLSRQGIDRIVRRLRNIQLGLALGGGGARGLAHLGVFQAFEEAAIHFDCMSGASCGAMLGILYAAGMEPDRTVRAFSRDLHPPQGFRFLPSSNNWYLFWQYRTGAWESMLRRYLHHWRLEQLPIPFGAVCVDLVSAREVIRDSGDAVQAILQSINLPGVSKPILVDGQALVDGSVLNTLPANALRAKNADLIVGVSVGSRPRAEFGGNRPDTPTPRMRSVGLVETLLRVIETQGRTLDAIQARGIDILVEPNTAPFSFSDFTRAEELAAVGRAAAEQQVAAIRWRIDALEQRATRELRQPRSNRSEA